MAIAHDLVIIRGHWSLLWPGNVVNHWWRGPHSPWWPWHWSHWRCSRGRWSRRGCSWMLLRPARTDSSWLEAVCLRPCTSLPSLHQYCTVRLHCWLALLALCCLGWDNPQKLSSFWKIWFCLHTSQIHWHLPYSQFIILVRPSFLVRPSDCRTLETTKRWLECIIQDSAS